LQAGPPYWRQRPLVPAVQSLSRVQPINEANGAFAKQPGPTSEMPGPLCWGHIKPIGR